MPGGEGDYNGGFPTPPRFSGWQIGFTLFIALFAGTLVVLAILVSVK